MNALKTLKHKFSGFVNQFSTNRYVIDSLSTGPHIKWQMINYEPQKQSWSVKSYQTPESDDGMTEIHETALAEGLSFSDALNYLKYFEASCDRKGFEKSASSPTLQGLKTAKVFKAVL